MDAVSMHNLRVVTHETYELSVWEGPEDEEHLDLKEVVLEVRVLTSSHMLSSAKGRDQDEGDDGTDSGAWQHLASRFAHAIASNARVRRCCWQPIAMQACTRT
jgi:hypothetical protein